MPDVLFQAHSAPLGIAFYDGKAFPPEYRGDAFVAMHGSWNRDHRTGYKLVRLRFEDGKPTGVYQDFMTGFVVDGQNVWGRPGRTLRSPRTARCSSATTAAGRSGGSPTPLLLNARGGGNLIARWEPLPCVVALLAMQRKCIQRLGGEKVERW